MDCNMEENILVWSQFLKPKIIFGLPLDKMDGLERSHLMVEALLKSYANEKYILIVNQQPEDLKFYMSFKNSRIAVPDWCFISGNSFIIMLLVGATSVSVLRSVWQTFWLNENWDSNGNVCDQVANSLMELEDRFEDFIQKLKDAEWDTEQLNLKVPKEISIDDINPL